MSEKHNILSRGRSQLSTSWVYREHFPLTPDPLLKMYKEMLIL
jgi:hypothetical protein